MSLRFPFFAVAALQLLAGCSTPPVLLQAKVPEHDFIATDSRLRVIANSNQGIFSTTGLVEPKSITCTEPSPDVATSLANSFGAGISLFGRGSGSLTAQQVEGLVQLGERTAAIQLLRDKMYQTCLAYSNGAISGTMYSLIMSRLDDAIVTLSLGDAAAGAFGRKLAGVGGEASAKADATVTGLPREIAKIEEQAEKLSAANKKVDDAAKALESHKATKPTEGKESDYAAQTTKLVSDLATAKGERNALLELVRSTAKTASEASGKISQLETGGGLTANPNALVLRDMQGDFLVADSGRDLVFACMVELGLRGDGSTENHLNTMVGHLEQLFLAKPGGELGAVYAGAILRSRGTALAKFCGERLPELIKDVAGKSHEYRILRATLNAQTSSARYSGENTKALVRERELFLESMKACKTEFQEDAERRNACFDYVMAVKQAQQPKPKPAPPVAATPKPKPKPSPTS